MKVWLKISKQQILAMKTKFYKNQNIFFAFFLKLHVLQVYNGLHFFLFSQDILQQFFFHMFYSNLNGGKKLCNITNNS